jgi:hypothetical protein
MQIAWLQAFLLRNRVQYRLGGKGMSIITTTAQE